MSTYENKPFSVLSNWTETKKSETLSPYYTIVCEVLPAQLALAARKNGLSVDGRALDFVRDTILDEAVTYAPDLSNHPSPAGYLGLWCKYKIQDLIGGQIKKDVDGNPYASASKIGKRALGFCRPSHPVDRAEYDARCKSNARTRRNYNAFLKKSEKRSKVVRACASLNELRTTRKRLTKLRDVGLNPHDLDIWQSLLAHITIIPPAKRHGVTRQPDASNT
jgi:hypothetical protein